MNPLGPLLTNSLAWWEKRRVPYNLLLTGVVLHYFYFNDSGVVGHQRVLQNLPVVFVLAVLANVCYCAAYLIDVPVQLSEFREPWLRHRWLLYGLGLLTGAALAQLACPYLPTYC